MTKEIKSLWGCIIVLFACVLVLGGVLLFRMDRISDNSKAGVNEASVAAVVGGETITTEQWIEELKEQYGSMVLERMMTIKAVQKEASALGIEVSDEEVEAELRRQMYGYESEEAYYTAMQEQMGMSPEQIREDVYQYLLLEQVAIYGIQVNEEELEDYLSEYQDSMSNPTSMYLSHIVVPDSETAELALERLAAGESFGVVAGALSTDTYSSGQGGSLGWIDDDDPFIDLNELMAVRLMDVGSWSQPVKVDEGYAIVMLNGRRETELYTNEALRKLARKEAALAKVPPLVVIEQQLREKYQAHILDEQERAT